MTKDAFIPFDDPRVEPPVPNEAQLQEKLFQTVQRTQEHNFSMHRHAFRGTHVKTQAVLKGTLRIKPDLPEELAQGICSPANAQRDHAAAIRFANEPPFLQDDRTPGPRGCGLKIFDIDGDFLDAIGQTSRTQDLTFNNAPILELRDLPTAVEIFSIRERHFREPEKIEPELKKRDDAELQLAPTQLPNRHFLSYTMYSQSAYRWGKYVAKYALFPSSTHGSLENTHQISNDSSPEQHSEWLRKWFTDGNDATFDLCVQLLEDPGAQPVEDCSVQWDETEFPFRTVATLTFPGGQDCFDSKKRTFWDDAMKLSPWYGLEAHRPLGSANRLRKELYKRSAGYRQQANARNPITPSSIDQIP